MNLLILKDDREFRQAGGWRLFHAHFAGHWEGDDFLVRKDRINGVVGQKMTAEQLTERVNNMLEMV